jgi:hypothetical protein
MDDLAILWCSGIMLPMVYIQGVGVREIRDETINKSFALFFSMKEASIKNSDCSVISF